MKKTLLSLCLLVLTLYSSAQVRIVQVDPAADEIILQNFGTTMVDISDYRLCALLVYTQNLTSVLTTGSTMLAPGATATLNWPLVDGASDLGLYLESSFGFFNVPAAMADFVQWGSGGNGRERMLQCQQVFGPQETLSQVRGRMPTVE